MSKISRETLIKACRVAIEARDNPVVINGFERRYRQDIWECGTACCVHGFAYLLEFGRPLPKDDDYFRDYTVLLQDYYDTNIPLRCFTLMEHWNTKPEQILELLE